MNLTTLPRIPEPPAEPTPRPFARLSAQQLKYLRDRQYDEMARISAFAQDDSMWVIECIRTELEYRRDFARHKRRQIEREAREALEAARRQRQIGGAA